MFFSCHIFAQESSLELVVGQQKVVEVDFPQRISIGNGNIADVFLTSNKKQVLITGKSVGMTDLIIWDKDGNKGIKRIVIWDKDPKTTAEEISRLLGEMDAIKVNIVGSSIVLEGELFKQEDLYRFNSIIKSYPSVINFVRTNPRLKQMVEIDVKIAEVDEGASKNFNPIPIQASYTVTGISSFSANSENVFNPSLLSLLDIWVKDGKARILAKPKLVVASGKEATFVAGGEIPYQVSQGEKGITTEWKKYGITLKIKPSLDAHGNIDLDIYSEASSPDYINASNGIPGILTRWVQTDLFLQRGETVIIAGLLQSTLSKTTQRVPVLGYIPVLNWFFSKSTFESKETELLIFVTPIVPAAIALQEFHNTGGE